MRICLRIFAALVILATCANAQNVSPNALFFRNPAGAGLTQTITVTPGTGLTATASPTFTGSWLTITTGLSGNTLTINVKANPAGLANGVYTGRINITGGSTTRSVPVILSVLPVTGGATPVPGPALILSPDNIAISATQGGAANIPAPVQLSNPNTQNYDWTTSSNQTWLTVVPSAGHGDTALRLIANAQGLTVGTYTGIVTVTSGTLTAQVGAILTVTPTQTSALVATPNLLAFQTNGTSTPLASNLQITNAGSNTLAYSVQTSVNNGGNWLSVNPLSGKSTFGQQDAGKVSVLVQPGTLTAGLYTGTVVINGGASKQTIPVYLRVGKLPVYIDRHELLFSYSSGAAQPASSVITLSGGPARTSFTAAATTNSGGNWLTITPSSGTIAAAGTPTPTTITATVQTAVIATLTQGIYYGQIAIRTPGAAQESTTVRVVLKVYGATDTSRMRLEPGGLIFQLNQGQALLQPATVTMTLSGVTPVITASGFQVNASVSTVSGGNWLSVNPNVALVTPATPLQISVSASANGLVPGTYSGVIVFTPITTTVPPVSLRVKLVVTNKTPSGEIQSGNLSAAFLNPSEGFISQPELPNTVTVAVYDSGGNLVSGANVVVHSSDGDPDLLLTDLGSGFYTGQLRAFNSGPLTLTGSTGYYSTSTGALVSDDFSVTGSMEPPQTAPVLPYPGGVVNAASFATSPTPIGAGGLASMFGQNIAGTGGAAGPPFPLPTQLGGASVTLGGLAAPMIAATAAATGDQINLQVPFELEGQTTAEVITTVNNVVAPTETILLGPIAGVFTTTANGSGIAAALHGADSSAITSAKPAAVGETISIFATGLGPVNEVVTTGAAAPNTTSAKNAVTATLGGQNAVISYAGLAPGFAGLYQVNLQVPNGAGTGNVALVISVAGNPSTGNPQIPLK